MNKTIWKFSLSAQQEQVIWIPGQLARPLSVGAQDGRLVLWAVCDPDYDAEAWLISVRGTGHPMGDELRGGFVGTAQLDGFVLHVFARRRDALEWVTDGSSSPILQFFATDHLPSDLAAISAPLCDLAEAMDRMLPGGPEKSAGLRKLLEAKDCFVRAALGPQ